MSKKMIMVEGNTAVANVAHATNEVIAIYPITPSSGMGEVSDALSAAGIKNIWGTIPDVTEMQSEGGASGAVHGALTSGSLTTTFTASQGLLLMIPNMFKIAGELTPTVFHVSARSVACQALSIFGDHSDVMTTRSTGFGLFCSGNVQEAQDFTLIAQAVALRSRVPFVHFFDGFRTSHEVQKIEGLSREEMLRMLDEDLIAEHRARALSPDRPTLKGSSQNPDVYFTGRETVNPYYIKAPGIMQEEMDKLAEITGRQYKLFDYVGHPEAEQIVIIMGSGAEAMHEMVDYRAAQGDKVGMIKVRLYRPFSMEALAAALPVTVRKIAVLDRTKEPGALGEPLYGDVRTAVGEAMSDGLVNFDAYPVIVGGRYGLGSAEFNAAMAKAVLDNLAADKPKNHFTVGIHDDVTYTSLEFDPDYGIPQEVHKSMFYGLGSDGTVGANKNSIIIIGENTDNCAQGYFVYDSKKAGAVTVSHLRFGKEPIRSTYLLRKADFIACHNFSFLEKYDMLANAEQGGTFLLNSAYGAGEVWDKVPVEVQQEIIDKKLNFYVIDAIKLASELGLGARINTIMQAAFFKISGILPVEKAVEAIRNSIEKSYGRKGERVVKMNFDAVDAGLKNIEQVDVPAGATSKTSMIPPVPAHAPEFVQNVTARIIEGKGDLLPVSAMPCDGTFPTGTTRYEKRNIAVDIPVWEPDVCIQCGQCSFVCPHASIRIKAYDADKLEGAPETFKSVDAKTKAFAGMKFTVQVAPEDCTGCGVCVETCPGKEKDENKQPTGRKAINMAPQAPLRDQEAENWDFFLAVPDTDPELYSLGNVKGSQLSRALFEFSGACAGCGETPYVKLLTQLFGDRLMIGNATGCSSIYGGNLPTTPYTRRADGRGPVWSNSLFEDNAEFAFGMRLTADRQHTFATELLGRIAGQGIARELIAEILAADQSDQAEIEAQRGRIDKLRAELEGRDMVEVKRLLTVIDFLVNKSVWAVGGDGWAYDIGYGGLDHVIASGKDVNILVLDTEVYSNTGGQMSKATPLGATAKFAAAGKPIGKKDLGMMAMNYGSVYVASICMGANMAQTVKAFMEAESYPGPSVIIAYSTCIAHGINMTTSMDNQKRAVASGHWINYRYDPRLAAEGKNPLHLDSKEPTIPVRDYAFKEIRYRSLLSSDPERAEMLMAQAQKAVSNRWNYYKKLSEIDWSEVGRDFEFEDGDGDGDGEK
ncbi:MAG: pyruvate:ferredoxin (flavodoxin) oxidoreductase [Candidatus Glassbacteria bacterium]|nr:pyruvate:ferredoxin (flavodoxin) oxidoreductase [Candidatus Glassbacteria bacterium]